MNPVNDLGAIPQDNNVFRCTRYAADYAGFDGKTLVPQGYIEIGTPDAMRLQAKVFLQGPYDNATGLMDDDLRSTSLPITEPYEALGYALVNSGSESVDNNLFTLTGNNAIVDWVFVELRDNTDSTLVVATRSALLQRDGDLVDTDGISPLSFSNVAEEDYYIFIKHRNHLSVMA